MADSPTEIAVVGAGPVGRALASAWQRAGLAVHVAVRTPDDARYDPYRGDHALVALTDLPAADATVLAVPGAALPALLEENGERLDGRLVVDATNQVGAGSLHQLPLLRRVIPAARVYRAFTTVGWENVRGDVHGTQPDLLYTGADSPDRAVVRGLVAATGMRPVWLGDGDEAADVLDGVARLWFALAWGAYRHGDGLGRDVAFRILTDRDPS